MLNHPNIKPVNLLSFFPFIKLNHKTMGTESCKTKDLEHNTGGNIKSVIDGILMIFITSPGMLTEQYMMLQVVLRQKFLVQWWNPDDILYTMYGYRAENDVASSLAEKFQLYSRKKAMSGSHLSLILWFLYKANFLSWIFKKLIDLFGFLPRGAFISAKKPGVQFN